MPKIIITDNIDLSNKDGFSKDDFYADKRNSVITSDAKANANVYKGTKKFYALLSTSDKEINNRMYSSSSWKKTVMDGAWQGKPYKKPILRNHDLYNSTPLGRINDSFYIEHNTLEVFNKDNNVLPQAVIDNYISQGCFESGSASVIVEFNADEDTAKRLVDGLDLTVSQSSFMNKATCNICGKDYFQSGGCNHVAGTTYEIEKDGKSEKVKCVLHTEDYEPIELSFVNLPANDTSTVFVFDGKNEKVKNKEKEEEEEVKEEPKKGEKKEKEEEEENSSEEKEKEKDKCKTKKAKKDAKEDMPKFDECEKPVQNVSIDNQEIIPTEDAMWKKFAKDHYSSQIKATIADNEELLNCFGDLFETMTQDQTEVFKNFVDALLATANAKDAVVTVVEEEVEVPADPVVEEEVEEPVETAEPEEAPVEPEVEVVETEAKEDGSKEDAVKIVFGQEQTKKTKLNVDNKALQAIIENIRF
jgi:hypothetical protein